MEKETRIALQHYLRRLIRYLSRSNKSAYAQMTPDEIIRLIKKSRTRPEVIRALLLPTGDLQEIAVDNGWGEKFNKLAREIGRLLDGDEDDGSGLGLEGEDSEEQQTKEDSVETQIDNLMQGLAKFDHMKVLKAYKALYIMGEKVLPVLREQLLAHDWSNVAYEREMRYLCGLFRLIHDIDERISGDIAQAIMVKGCSSQVKTCLQLVRRFSVQNYVRERYGKIEIYIS